MATTRLMQKDAVVKSSSSYSVYSRKYINASVYSPASSPVHRAESDYLYLSFEEVPESIALHEITGATLYVDADFSGYGATVNHYLYAYALASAISHESGYQKLTLSDQGSFGSFFQQPFAAGKISLPLNVDRTKSGSYLIANVLRYGVELDFDITTRTYDSAFYATVSCYADDERPVYLDLVTSSNIVHVDAENKSPKSGFINEKKDNVFSWSLVPAHNRFAGELKQSAFRIEWRVKGSQSVNAISRSDWAAGTFTVPANTFPSTGEIEWRVVSTYNGSYTATSDWASFTTTEALSTARTLNPVNGIRNAAEESIFEWSHQISTGTEPKGADLQYSTDGSSWISLAHVDGNALSYTAAPNSLPGGSLLWRVRTYNSDNLPGEWSEPARFVMIGAPSAPVLNVTPSPRPLIAWQSAEQQAWQLEIPGVLELKPEFGYTYQYRPNMLLDDGTYTARVRVQNGLGIWSEWAETRFTVQNVPGQAVTLSASSNGLNAFLAWSPASVGTVLIYRDGQLIAKTNGATYEDAFGNGRTQYKVRALDGENYSESNTVTVDINIDTAAICTVEDKEWLPLKYSQRSNNLQDMSYSREGEYVHVSGARLPLAEISSFESESVTIECAFLDGEESRRLYEMRSKLVCLKLRRGVTVIGPLLNLSREINDFYENYQITVRNTHFEEAVSFEDD